ncbi:PBSX family phage terminase large subunit [Hymenobacter koreensis]|uniref:Terminase family protein n=1 Tax=Hymenobacter koreensis TaxID=1084523 RepID=A0ABP8JNA6_9BACT
MSQRLTLTPELQLKHKPYQPFGAAIGYLYDQYGEVLLEGPAGTGKSRVNLEKVHLICEKYPNTRVLIVRKTRVSCTESVLVTFEEKVLPEGSYLTDGAQRENRRSYQYRNGSSIVVGGMDKASRFMSTEFDLIYIPEATEFTEAEWESLASRINRPGQVSAIPYNQILADCNPDAPTHWLNQRCISGKTHRHVSRHEDNPGLFNHATGEWTQAGRAYMETLERLSGVRYARLRQGIWAAADGLIYETFDTAVHVIDAFPIPPQWRRIRSIDFGYTNPFVCQWWAISPDDIWYLYREIYHTQRLVEDHAKDILRLSQGERFEATYADHDAEDRATLERYGIRTIAANKAVSSGIQQVQSMLNVQANGKARLYVMRGALQTRDRALTEAKKPACTEEEFPGYTWEQQKDGRPNKEVPVKLDDHGMDTMRYAVYTPVASPRRRGLLG